MLEVWHVFAIHKDYPHPFKSRKFKEFFSDQDPVFSLNLEMPKDWWSYMIILERERNITQNNDRHSEMSL